MEPIDASQEPIQRLKDDEPPERVELLRVARQTERVERGLIEAYMLGSLDLSAVRWQSSPIWLERGLECYRYLAGRSYERGQRGFTHLPFSLVVDLLVLVELGESTPFSSQEGAAQWEIGERRLRVDYENQLLASLLQEPAFIEARDRLTLDPEVRPGAVRRLVELLLQKFGRHYPRYYEVNPTHVRELTLPNVAELDSAEQRERFERHVADPLVYRDGLSEMLRGISNNVYWRELLLPEDLFEIEHWALLDSESTRIGVRQISQVERRLGEHRLPRVRLRREAMEAETDFEDDTVYPTGGFSGLTNRGSFENLVRSELVYMGEGTPISLFDLRFSENELLFYLRHDGVMRRRRRFVHLILDLDTAFYYKSPGYDYPFATLTQGLIVRLARDLIQAFQEDAVTIHVHYRYRPNTEALSEEATEREREREHVERERERVERELSLVRLSLSREIRQEMVAVELVEEVDLEAIQQSRGRVYAVALCFTAERERLWRELFAELEHARPPVQGIVFPVALDALSEASLSEERSLALPLSGATMGEIAQMKNELFARIVSGRR